MGHPQARFNQLAPARLGLKPTLTKQGFFKGARMQIELIKIDQVIPYENNPRINEKAVVKVAESLNEFGWQQPVVIDEQNIILAGHTRVRAALSLGWDAVPCFVATGLSDAQKTAYRIADNKTAEFADWDKELLAGEFALLAELDYDMGFTAFDLDDIAKINDALLEFEGEDDLEEELEEDDLDGTVASHVKMVNLYLDQQSEPRFRAMCDKIMAANNLESITDAVVLAVENEHKNL